LGGEFKIFSHNKVMRNQELLEIDKESDIKKRTYSSLSLVYVNTVQLTFEEQNRLKQISPCQVFKLIRKNLCYLYYKNFKVLTVSLKYLKIFGEGLKKDVKFSKNLYESKVWF